MTERVLGAKNSTVTYGSAVRDSLLRLEKCINELGINYGPEKSTYI